MNKEEIESLFKKYKVRIPKEKQGQSECYECKRHHKYSLTWTSFLYEYEEKYYCFEHIVIILLQQENQELKMESEKLTQLWLDSQEKRRKAIEYLEQPYRDNFDYSKAELLNILQNERIKGE